MPVTIDGTSGITTPTYNGADTSEYIVPVTAFKNRIINGDMRIDQRYAGASVNATAATNTYSIDRWGVYQKLGSSFTVQQNAGSVTPPAGFTNYLGFTVTAARTPAAGDIYYFWQVVEGYNVADFNFGTASASTFTLSFWVRSSLTGTFGGAFTNDGTRSYPFTFVINSANTWEYKTVTVTGDVTGTWATNNQRGMYIRFDLGSGSTFRGTAGSWVSSDLVGATGSVNVIGTNGATFYITGVQLEKGSTATSFDYRPYGTELQLCQRYYYKIQSSGTNPIASGYNANASTAQYVITYPVIMRAAPTALEQSGTANNYAIAAPAGVVVCSSVPVFVSANTNIAAVNFTATITSGQPSIAYLYTGTAYLGWSAEL